MEFLFSKLHLQTTASALGVFKAHEITSLVEFLSFQKQALRGSLKVSRRFVSVLKRDSTVDHGCFTGYFRRERVKNV